MTKIKVLELMDAIQQTQKTADDMWRVLREVLEEQRNAQQNMHWTAATPCPCCKGQHDKRLACPKHMASTPPPVM